jgi:hypothetical protein
VNLRAKTCYILARLRLHNPDCQHCNAHSICGNELIERLRQLNSPEPAIPAPANEEKRDKNTSAA